MRKRGMPKEFKERKTREKTDSQYVLISHDYVHLQNGQLALLQEDWFRGEME